MAFDKIAYPWFFFYRITRLAFVIFLPTLLTLVFFYRQNYKENYYVQAENYLKSELSTLKHSLGTSKDTWVKWCETLPENRKSNFEIVQDNKVLCSKNNSNAGVISEIEITPELILRGITSHTTLSQGMDEFDNILFRRILPISSLSFLLFILFFYITTKPLGVILSKVKRYKSDIPFNKNIRLLYQRDEWAAIEEALNKADEEIKERAKEAQAENDKSTVILESINDDIIAVDRFETILFYNSKFKNDFLKKDSYSQIHPKLWHTFEDQLLLESFRSVLSSGKSTSLKRMNFPNSHTPDRFYDITITPLTTTSKNVSGAIGVFYDVTEFKLSEQMRVDFVANVSHEIRTPLTSVKGYTQILQSQSDKIDSSLHDFLGKIIGNTERMISLFNDLLNLSVLESRNIHTFESIDLQEIIESVSENIKTNYPEKNIVLKSQISLQAINGDYRLMEQVLSNLMDNACKYSTSESISIKFSSYEKDGKGIISLSDDGPGISKEHLQRIFERFYRVDSSREISRGTGLGLSIVKHIINKHKGRIWAESDGKGTTFLIELPLE